MNNLINRIKRQFSSQLLRKEHISYLLEWNKLLGNKKKVLYNAMGPDLSTVLLFANPTEIIGVDPKGFFRDTFNGKELILNGKKLTVIENQQKSTIKLPRLYTKVYFVDETTVILSDNSKIDLYRFDGQIQLVYTLENVTDYDIDHDNRVIYYLKSNKELMLFDINLQKNELLDNLKKDLKEIEKL